MTTPELQSLRLPDILTRLGEIAFKLETTDPSAACVLAALVDDPDTEQILATLKAYVRVNAWPASASVLWMEAEA